MKNIILVSIVTATLFSCNAKEESKTSFDLVAAKAEIATSNKEFESYVSKSDSTGLATNLYTADTKVLVPNGPTAVGRAQAISVFSGIFQSGIAGIKLTTADIWGDGNTITEEGTFTLNTKDGTVVDNGKYIVLWKKEDGKWKIHRDSFNSDAPAAAPAK